MNIYVKKIAITLAAIVCWLKIALTCVFLCIYLDSKIGSKMLQIAMRFAKIGITFTKIEPLVTLQNVTFIAEDCHGIVKDCDAFSKDCHKWQRLQ